MIIPEDRPSVVIAGSSPRQSKKRSPQKEDNLSEVCAGKIFGDIIEALKNYYKNPDEYDARIKICKPDNKNILSFGSQKDLEMYGPDTPSFRQTSGVDTTGLNQFCRASKALRLHDDHRLFPDGTNTLFYNNFVATKTSSTGKFDDDGKDMHHMYFYPVMRENIQCTPVPVFVLEGNSTMYSGMVGFFSNQSDKDVPTSPYISNVAPERRRYETLNETKNPIFSTKNRVLGYLFTLFNFVMDEQQHRNSRIIHTDNIQTMKIHRKGEDVDIYFPANKTFHGIIPMDDGTKLISQKRPVIWASRKHFIHRTGFLKHKKYTSCLCYGITSFFAGDEYERNQAHHVIFFTVGTSERCKVFFTYTVKMTEVEYRLLEQFYLGFSVRDGYHDDYFVRTYNPEDIQRVEYIARHDATPVPSIAIKKEEEEEEEEEEDIPLSRRLIKHATKKRRVADDDDNVPSMSQTSSPHSEYMAVPFIQPMQDACSSSPKSDPMPVIEQVPMEDAPIKTPVIVVPLEVPQPVILRYANDVLSKIYAYYSSRDSHEFATKQVEIIRKIVDDNNICSSDLYEMTEEQLKAIGITSFGHLLFFSKIRNIVQK